VLDRPLGSGSDRQEEEEVDLAVVLVILAVRGKRCWTKAALETANHFRGEGYARPSRVPDQTTSRSRLNRRADHLGQRRQIFLRPWLDQRMKVVLGAKTEP